MKLTAVFPWVIPNGYVVKSIKYGSIDLLKESLTVPPKDTAEIVVTLGIAQ